MHKNHGPWMHWSCRTRMPWDEDMGELWDAGTEELQDTRTTGHPCSVPRRQPAHQVVEGVRQLLGHLQLPACGHLALALVLLQVEVQGSVPDVLLHHDTCRGWVGHTVGAGSACALRQRGGAPNGDGHSLSFPRLTPCSSTRCLWESWLMMLAASRKDWERGESGSGRGEGGEAVGGTPPSSVPGWGGGAAPASPRSSCGGCRP